MRSEDTPTDLLGEPYTAETIDLAPDDQGEVVTTLVRRLAGATPGTRAVLYVHGFCDYFFHTPTADFWIERGYDFYAVDLRKYGRSLRPHQTPNFITDLATYFEDLDAVHERIMERDGHSELLIHAHSTGGLIAPLWLNERRHDVLAVVLNSPWLDLQGSFLLRTAGTRAIEQVGLRRPYQAIPRTVSGLYGKSIHRQYNGAWDFDLTWKPIESFPVYAGWLRAIRRGHSQLHRGVDLPAPILMLSSGASTFPREWQPSVDSTDIVLDVEQMWRWAPKLGHHVTMIRVEGALHDLSLSAEPARTTYFAEIDRWLTAYVDEPPGSRSEAQ